jgi:hypothetical protein
MAVAGLVTTDALGLNAPVWFDRTQPLESQFWLTHPLLSRYESLSTDRSFSMEKIEIDWEIHQMIEAERKGFAEPRYLALRRLLGLSAPAAAPAPETAPIVQALGDGMPWTKNGVTIPHGAPARMEYGRGSWFQVYEGQFLNGRLVVNDQSFDTLSAAAKALATTKDGKKTSLDGWLYWKVKLPGDTEWRSIGGMRRDPPRVVFDDDDPDGQ